VDEHDRVWTAVALVLREQVSDAVWLSTFQDVNALPSSSSTELREGGGGLGYNGMPNSVAVEFDTWLNNGTGDPYNDPSQSHIGVHTNGTGAFLRSGATTDLLLVAGGIVTVVPLLLFATAVRRIPLSVVGILQYIAPTIQLLLGVFAFKEPFTRAQVSGFGLVWVGLVIFTIDSLRPRSASTLVMADQEAR